MDGDKASRLLTLPREVRNNIYDYVSIAVDITPLQRTQDGKPLPHPTLQLHRTTMPALLRVCKQIHSEYKQQLSGRAKLSIIGAQSICLVGTLRLKQGISTEILENVRGGRASADMDLREVHLSQRQS